MKSKGDWKGASNGPESVEMMPAKGAVDASYRAIGAGSERGISGEMAGLLAETQVDAVQRKLTGRILLALTDELRN